MPAQANLTAREVARSCQRPSLLTMPSLAIATCRKPGCRRERVEASAQTANGSAIRLRSLLAAAVSRSLALSCHTCEHPDPPVEPSRSERTQTQDRGAPAQHECGLLRTLARPHRCRFIV